MAAACLRLRLPLPLSLPLPRPRKMKRRSLPAWHRRNLKSSLRLLWWALPPRPTLWPLRPECRHCCPRPMPRLLGSACLLRPARRPRAPRGAARVRRAGRVGRACRPAGGPPASGPGCQLLSGPWQAATPRRPQAPGRGSKRCWPGLPPCPGPSTAPARSGRWAGAAADPGAAARAAQRAQHRGCCMALGSPAGGCLSPGRNARAGKATQLHRENELGWVSGPVCR